MSESVPRWDLADRLRKSLREAGIGVREMADYLGVSRITVSTWINGHNRPSAPAVHMWAERTGVSYLWLRKGDGIVPTAGELPARLPAAAGLEGVSQLRKQPENTRWLGVAA